MRSDATLTRAGFRPDIDLCSAVVRDICVDNAVRYFSLPAAWITAA
jgi:hypothetical protein